MSSLTLIIGSKSYSSWSMRAWLLLARTGVPFEEIVIQLYTADTRARILEHSEAGTVPILKTDDVTVWDSLAIAETLNEMFPDAALWPDDPIARAQARAICNEMHSGFSDLRRDMPFNPRAAGRRVPISKALNGEISRIQEIWTQCRERFGGDGDLLFGEFTIADAMYAPVVSRFRTYGVKVNPISRAYMDAVWSLPIVQRWLKGHWKRIMLPILARLVSEGATKVSQGPSPTASGWREEYYGEDFMSGGARRR